MDVPIDVSQAVFRTERLILRAPKPDDLTACFAYASVPGVGEMAGWKHHESLAESEAYLQRIIENKQVFAIACQESGKLIGTLGFRPSWANEEKIYAKYKVKEIGFSLSKVYWGRGLMTEAVRGVIDYAFGTLDLEALTCCHYLQNDRSRRVIEKCGFQFVKQSTHTSVQLQITQKDRKYIRIRETRV